MDKKKYLVDSFRIFGLTLNEEQIRQFLIYEELLIEWNNKMNLTAITDFQDIVWKHFIDSVSVCQSRNVSRETWTGNLIDVGTGAGFPGIPLKILHPECRITLLDSLNKRIRFLDTVVQKCHLEQVYLIHGRAEDVAHNAEYREQYDICVSRAVANLSTLAEYCLPFLKTGGTFISYKSSEMDAELKNSRRAVDILGGKISTVEKFTIPVSDLQRTFIIIQKTEHTSDRYPRKAGIPGKKPISG